MQTPKSCQVSPSLFHPPPLQPSTFYPQVLRCGDQPARVELLDGHRVRHRPLSCQVAPAAGLEVALQDSEEGALKDVRLPRLGHGLPAQQVTSCLWKEKNLHDNNLMDKGFLSFLSRIMTIQYPPFQKACTRRLDPIERDGLPTWRLKTSQDH